MRRLAAMLVKELLQLRRDRKLLPFLFVVPVVQLVILGYAATTDVRRVPMAFCDLDHSPESQRMEDRFVASTYFSLVARVGDQREIDALLQSGRARIAITIPAGFGSARERGEATSVQILADGSDPLVGTAALGNAANLIHGISAPGSRPLIDFRPVVLYNPDLVSRSFMVPAVFALIIMVSTMMLTAMAVVRETEIGTMEQLLVTPLTPGHLVVGKLVPYFLVGLVEVMSALPVVLWWFRIPLQGSLFTLLLLTVPFMLCTLGLGLLISTLSRTQQQAMMLAAFIFMIPQIYLSGFAFPIQSMPRFFQVVTYAIPLRYYVTILRGVFLKGVGLPELWPQALALLVIGIAVLSAARLRFQRRLA